MKKSLILAGCLLACAARQAGAFSVGGGVAFPVGGDVNDPSAGFEFHAAGMIDDIFSAEVYGAKFEDSYNLGDVDFVDLDVVSIGATGIAGMNLAPDLRLYAGAGLDLNLFNGRLRDEIILYDPQTGLALSTEFNFDSSIGYHACAGATMNIGESLQLFAEYRYTFTKLKGDMPLTGINYDVTLTVPDVIDEDYAFGLAVVGINLVF